MQKEKKSPQASFITSDLSLVAFLKLQNYAVLRIDHQNGGRASFTLQDQTGREELVLRFFNRETTIEPLGFLDQIRNLKALIRQT